MSNLSKKDLKLYLEELSSTSSRDCITNNLIKHIKSLSSFDDLTTIIITHILRITNDQSLFSSKFLLNYLLALPDMPHQSLKLLFDSFLSDKLILLFSPSTIIKFLNKLDDLDTMKEKNTQAQDNSNYKWDNFDSYIEKIVDLYVNESKLSTEIIKSAFQILKKTPNANKNLRYIVKNKKFVIFLNNLKDETDFVTGIELLDKDNRVNVEIRFLKNKTLQKRYLESLIQGKKYPYESKSGDLSINFDYSEVTETKKDNSEKEAKKRKVNKDDENSNDADKRIIFEEYDTKFLDFEKDVNNSFLSNKDKQNNDFYCEKSDGKRKKNNSHENESKKVFNESVLKNKMENNITGLECKKFQKLYDLYKNEPTRIILVQKRDCCDPCKEIVNTFALDSDYKIRAKVFEFHVINSDNVLDVSKDVRNVIFKRIIKMKKNFGKNTNKNKISPEFNEILLNLFKGILTKFSDEYINFLMSLDIEFHWLYQNRNEFGVKNFLDDQRKKVLKRKKPLDNFLLFTKHSDNNSINIKCNEETKEMIECENDFNDDINLLNSKKYKYSFFDNLQTEDEKIFFLKYCVYEDFPSQSLSFLISEHPFYAFLYFKNKGNIQDDQIKEIIYNLDKINDIKKYKEVVLEYKNFIKENCTYDSTKIINERLFYFYSVFDDADVDFITEICSRPKLELYEVYFISKYSKNNRNVYNTLKKYLNENVIDDYNLIDILINSNDRKLIMEMIDRLIKCEITHEIVKIFKGRLNFTSLMIYFLIGGVLKVKNEKFLSESILLISKGLKSDISINIKEKIKKNYKNFVNKCDPDMKNKIFSIVLNMRRKSTKKNNEYTFLDNENIKSENEGSIDLSCNSDKENKENISDSKYLGLNSIKGNNSKKINHQSIPHSDKVLYFICDFIKDTLKGCKEEDIGYESPHLHDVDPSIQQLLHEERF